MSAPNALEALAGFLLVFFVPGYALTRALFPEWRVRGSDALRRLVEVVTLSFVVSIALTVLVGYLELTVAPGGFRAYWTDPVLEVSLAAIALVAVALGILRGAYRREPPPPVRRFEGTPGGEGAFELTRRLDLLSREERRIRHALRVALPGPPEEGRLRSRLSELESERAEIQRAREAEYAE